MNRPSYFNQNLNNGTTETSSANSNPIFAIEPMPYPVIIKKVEDNEQYSALILYFDIADGQLQGVFGKDSGGDFSKWNRKGKIWVNYGEQDKDNFEAFITSVRRSNQGFAWDWNEQKLVGKRIVVVYGQEEFQTQDTREIKLTTKPRMIRSMEAYMKGEIKPLPIKRLKNKAGGTNTYGNRNYNANNQSYKSQNNFNSNYSQPNVNDTFDNSQNYNVEVNDDDLPF